MRAFHNGKEDVNRGAGRNFIPAENIYLSGFARVHEYLSPAK
jgi:hypothetical protein